MKKSKWISLSLVALILLPSLSPASAFRYGWHRNNRYARYAYANYYRPYYRPERVVYVAPEPACVAPERVVYEEPVRPVVYEREPEGNPVAGALLAGIVVGAIANQAFHHH